MGSTDSDVPGEYACSLGALLAGLTVCSSDSALDVPLPEPDGDAEAEDADADVSEEITEDKTTETEDAASETEEEEASGEDEELSAAGAATATEMMAKYVRRANRAMTEKSGR